MSNYNRDRIHAKEKKIFGERLKLLLDRNGITQNKLSEILDVGVQTVSNWVHGYYFPDTDTMLRIADHFGCDIDYLTGRLSESTHDIHFVHEFTGLSEEAIKKICYPELNHPYSEPLSNMIESERFSNLITTYKIFLTFLKRIEVADLEKLADYELNDDTVVLGRNEAANHFKQEVSLAMTHLCEDNYSDRVQKIIQDIPTPFSLSMENYRARVQEDTKGDE